MVWIVWLHRRLRQRMLDRRLMRGQAGDAAPRTAHIKHVAERAHAGRVWPSPAPAPAGGHFGVNHRRRRRSRWRSFLSLFSCAINECICTLSIGGGRECALSPRTLIPFFLSHEHVCMSLGAFLRPAIGYTLTTQCDWVPPSSQR